MEVDVKDFSYKFDFDDVIKDDDRILEYDTIKVVIDKPHCNLLMVQN